MFHSSYRSSIIVVIGERTFIKSSRKSSARGRDAIFLLFSSSNDDSAILKICPKTMKQQKNPHAGFSSAFFQTACDSCAGDQPEQSTTAQEKCDSRRFAKIRGWFNLIGLKNPIYDIDVHQKYRIISRPPSSSPSSLLGSFLCSPRITIQYCSSSFSVSLIITCFPSISSETTTR